MKKGYVLVIKNYENNHSIHETFDTLEAVLFLDKEKAINALKERAKDSLEWALCDYSKEEIVSAYQKNNGMLEGGQEIEEYEETDTTFYISCDAGNFEFSNNYKVEEIDVNSDKDIEDLKLLVIQRYLDDRSKPFELKIFDNEEELNTFMTTQLDEFAKRMSNELTFDSLVKEFDKVDNIDEIVYGDKQLDDISNEDNEYKIAYYNKTPKKSEFNEIVISVC